MTKILAKILAVLMIAVTLLNMCAKGVMAAVELNLDKAYIQTIGYADNHLKYYREKYGYHTYYTTIVAGYTGEDGNVYPVYCLDRLLPGADEEPYYVTTGNLLKNDKIWRIIRNGYPFKTAKEYGLSEDYNLYAVTRFAIYCVLGQTKLEYFMAEDDDEEAKKMLKVLEKLVDIGENGTEVQDEDPLSIQEVGEFKESGEYYIQEYKVNSTSDFNEYKIEKTSGMPEGAYVSNKDGKEKLEFSKGENFFIKVPKSQLTEDLNIDVEISAECKVYIVLEGKTTVSGTQNYAVTAGEYSKATASINLQKDVNTGKIIINKVDKDDKVPIQGVEFELLDEDGKTVATATTSEDGIAEFQNLVQGAYTLVESKTNEKYILQDEKFELNVEYNKIIELTIENEKKKRKLRNIQSR